MFLILKGKEFRRWKRFLPKNICFARNRLALSSLLAGLTRVGIAAFSSLSKEGNHPGAARHPSLSKEGKNRYLPLLAQVGKRGLNGYLCTASSFSSGNLRFCSRSLVADFFDWLILSPRQYHPVSTRPIHLLLFGPSQVLTLIPNRYREALVLF